MLLSSNDIVPLSSSTADFSSSVDLDSAFHYEVGQVKTRTPFLDGRKGCVSSPFLSLLCLSDGSVTDLVFLFSHPARDSDARLAQQIP